MASVNHCNSTEAVFWKKNKECF